MKTKKILALILAVVMCLGILSVSASAAGETYTVIFDVTTFSIPGDLISSWPTPITVTNGDKWNLSRPTWFTATEYTIGWYTIDLEPIVNGDVISLNSDVTIYACPVDYANSARPVAPSEYDKIAATASAWAQADVAEAFKAGLIPENRVAFKEGNLGFAIPRVNFCELIAEVVEAKTGIGVSLPDRTDVF